MRTPKSGTRYFRKLPDTKILLEGSLFRTVTLRVTPRATIVTVRVTRRDTVRVTIRLL